ncbi:MAG: hypothetical protein A3G92_07445 [Deltaproteobacteria bacterium RIFCSPLOWO2_12_FULL_38_8]|nr:MAG: hypothetical protein A3G92_07445 [Deltaproteobacteria bacterium RIFCSPLOWO2_12_FULL_38_8]
MEINLNNTFDFKKITYQVQGWLTENEGHYLYKKAKNVQKNNAIVEIGSWKGRSTVCLASGAKEGQGAIIYAVDPHQGSDEQQQKGYNEKDTFKEFKFNIQTKKVDGFIHAIRETSKEASLKINYPVEFIFIDGLHKYKNVYEDYKLWFPKVIDGGIMAFHDSLYFLGPMLTTAIALCFSGKVKNPKIIDNITCFQKTNKISTFERLNNIFFCIYRLFYSLISFKRLCSSEEM